MKTNENCSRGNRGFKPAVFVILISLSFFAIFSFPLAAADKTISLDLKDAEISDVLTLLGKEMGRSVVVGKEVIGRLSVSLQNISAEEALKQIVAMNELVMTQKDNLLVITSSRPPQFYKLKEGLFLRSFRVNYVEPEEAEKSLLEVLSPAAKVVTTKDSRTLVVEAPLSDITKAEILLASVDVAPEAVIVEAKIIELKKTEGSNLGVNLKNQVSGRTAQTLNFADSPYASGAQGVFFSVVENDAQALLSALSSLTGYNLLSSPKVLAVSGEKAEIITGERLGYYIKTVNLTGVVESVEFMDVGTKLTLQPKIKSDGNIVMTIHPEISTGSIVNGLPALPQKVW